jgi:hypothetical protein
MDENKPQIALLHLERIDRSNFIEFEDSVKAESLDVRIESRPDPGPYAGMEWVVPTAIVVYVGKAYFESFLKEVGKDHYAILKKAVIKLSSKFTGAHAPRSRIVFSRGKAESEAPRYSLVYSIVADIGSGLRAKLLLQSDFDADTCNAAQEAFLDFLSDLDARSLDLAKIDGLAGAKPLGNTLLLAYDPAKKGLRVVDPRRHGDTETVRLKH